MARQTASCGAYAEIEFPERNHARKTYQDFGDGFRCRTCFVFIDIFFLFFYTVLNFQNFEMEILHKQDGRVYFSKKKNVKQLEKKSTAEIARWKEVAGPQADKLATMQNAITVAEEKADRCQQDFEISRKNMELISKALKDGSKYCNEKSTFFFLNISHLI